MDGSKGLYIDTVKFGPLFRIGALGFFLLIAGCSSSSDFGGGSAEVSGTVLISETDLTQIGMASDDFENVF